ncbi:MAG: hypothetical protein ACRD8O_03920, partial [Bryobacteraceae bacterium]
TAGAMASYVKAAGILDKLAAPEGAVAARSSLADAHMRLGALLRVSGDIGGGLKSYRVAQALLEGLLAKDPRNKHLEARLAGLYDNLARHLTAVNDLKGAVEITTKALALYEDLAAADPRNAALQSDLASSYATAGILMARTEQLNEALAQYRKGLAIRERLVTEDPANVPHRRNLMILSSHLGDVLASPTRPSLGETEQAMQHYRRMLRIAEELAASDASDRKARLDLANSLLRIGHVLGAGAANEDSLRYLRRSLGIVDELKTGDPANTGLRTTAAFLHTRMGEVLEQRGAAAEALAHFEQGWMHARAVLAKDPKNAELQNQFLHASRGYGRALARRGKREQAVEVVELMLPVAEGIARPGSEWRFAAQRPNADLVAGEAYLELARHAGSEPQRQQDRAKARTYLERSRNGWQELQSEKRLSRLYTGEPARTAALLAGIQ